MLRPVGTMNWKDAANPRPVELLGLSDEYTFDEFAARLQKAAEPYRASFARASAISHANGSLPLGSLDVSTPKEFDPIYRGCRQIREAPFESEEVWRGMLSVVRLCERGDEWCHLMSKQDAKRYRREDTEAKLATLARQQGVGGMPMTCATFNDKRPGICTACCHWGAIRSPILLGFEGTPILAPVAAPAGMVNGEGVTQGDFIVPHTRAPEACIEIPRLRDSRFQLVTPDEVADGKPMGVYFMERTKGEDGTEQVRAVQICHQPVYVQEASYVHDINGRLTYTWWAKVYDIQHRRWYDVPLPARAFSQAADLLRELYEQGVTVVPSADAAHRLEVYMKAYVDLINRTRAAVTQHVHYGYASPSLFVHGPWGWELGADGEVRLDTLAASLAPALQASGTLEKWKQAANLYARPGMELMAFGLFTGFGAPLLHFTECAGFLVHLYGESGAGKTALQRIVASQWGNPKTLMEHAPVSKYGSTHNAFMSKLGTLHNIPVMIDEFSLAADEEIFPLVHALASGEEKDRMTSALKMREGHTWQSIYLSSANRSLRRMLDGHTETELAAVHNRLIEIELPAFDRNDQTWMADQSTVILALENFGHVGPALVQWIMKNAQRLPDIIRRKMEWLMRRAGARRDERQWFAAIAAILTGAELARAAGLHDIDVARVEKWVLEVLLPAQRVGATEARRAPGTILGEFVNDNHGNMVAVIRSRLSVMDDEEKDVIREPGPGCKLRMRYERNRGLLYIARCARGAGRITSITRTPLRTCAAAGNWSRSSTGRFLGAGCRGWGQWQTLKLNVSACACRRNCWTWVRLTREGAGNTDG